MRLGEFEIVEVVGVGGFGIVYRAREPALEREVALKEYMPMGMVGRGGDGRVTLRSRQHEEDFALGLRSFVNEARLLARFDHPALVKVHRFWEANGTAYMAMPFYKAQTLRQRRQEMGSQPPTQAWLLSMVEPLLGALAEMHRADVFHRDIAPDNILWCADNRPVLLDFGAARRAHPTARSRSPRSSSRNSRPSSSTPIRRRCARARGPTCSRWPAPATSCSPAARPCRPPRAS